MNAPADGSPSLLRIFWAGVALFAGYVLFAANGSAVCVLLGCLIAAAAFVPVYLWCAGQAPGLPIFPSLAMSHLWTFALPLIHGHRSTLLYEPEEIVRAGLTVVGFLGLATLVWWATLRRPVAPPSGARVMDGESCDTVLLGYFAIACAFLCSALARWIVLEGGLFSAVRSFCLGLSVLAIVGLSYRLGAGQLSTGKKVAFFTLFVLFALANSATLFLIATLSATLLATVVYMTASRRVPFIPLLIVVAVAGVLHMGKTEMRAKYWRKGHSIVLRPWQYPAYFGEWAQRGLTRLASPSSVLGRKRPKQATLVDRASLIQMLLLVQHKSPDPLPYLQGKTYTTVPAALVPRILNPEKGRAHAGTDMLCVYYGLQSARQTKVTTIGFGLLSEAFANFGYLGVVALALITGLTNAWVARLCLHTPMLSLRSLFGLVFLAGQLAAAEASASVVISSLCQASATLVVATFFFMKRLPLAAPEPEVSATHPMAEVYA